jgi:hypothetical protein
MTVRLLPLVLGLLTIGPQAEAASDSPALPGWMAGCWQSSSGDRWSEECWMSPRGGMMLGTSRSGSGDRVTEWEALRIERDAASGMAYRASPQGRGWTTFAWSADGRAGLTFTNAAHDYPQRIRYWREGALLKAEISLLDGSRARQWTFRSAR